METPKTMFAIVNADETKEYCGIRNGKPIFVERTIPHKGKRYKTFSGAIGTSIDLRESYNAKSFVIETLI